MEARDFERKIFVSSPFAKKGEEIGFHFVGLVLHEMEAKGHGHINVPAFEFLSTDGEATSFVVPILGLRHEGRFWRELQNLQIGRIKYAQFEHRVMCFQTQKPFRIFVAKTTKADGSEHFTYGIE